jgi:hypothetical protein
VSKVRKALLAALTAGVGSLGAAAVAGLAVWRVPNAPQVR